MYCSRCGENIQDRSKFCGSCGVAVAPDARRNEISDAVQKFLANLVDQQIAPDVMALDRIDQKKLSGARKSYLKSINETETVLVLYDDTLIGNGKKGFAITDTQFFARIDRYWGGEPRYFQIALSEIGNFRIEKGKLGTSNIFINDKKVGNITLGGIDLPRTNMLLSLVIADPKSFLGLSLFPAGDRTAEVSTPSASIEQSTADANASAGGGNWFLQLCGGAVMMAISYFLFMSYSEFSNTSGASQIIKESLKSPSSFNEIDTRLLWEGKNKDGKDSKIVRVEYEAQNGFGATIRNCQIVSYFEDGDNLRWHRMYGLQSCELGFLNESAAVELFKETNFGV